MSLSPTARAVLQIIQHNPGISATEIGSCLGYAPRNALSELTNQSAIRLDHQHGYHLTPGGKFLLEYA